MTWKKYKYLYRTFEINEKGQVKNENGVVVKGSLHKNGFRVLNLRLEGERGTIVNKGLLIHRMVAQCWIENPKEKPYVIHKDGNLQNNAVKNLEWATPNEKIERQKQLGKHGNSKLSTKDVLQIKRLLKTDEAKNVIAKKFNVSHTQIRRISTGENWQ